MVGDWQDKVLRELCEITSSKRIYAADYQPGGVPFYRGKEIIEKHKGSLEVSTDLFISESKFLEIKHKFGAPQPGDLLLTSVGTLGVPYVVKTGEEFYFKDGNLTWFRNFKNLDSRFLYYWLLSPQGKAELKKCTIGSSQSAFTIVLLKDMRIELPVLPIQRRIASILSAYDDLIENNTQRIKILEEMARLIYHEWFVEFRAPGVKLRKATPEEKKVTGKDVFPVGWEIAKLSALVETQYGYTESASEVAVGPKFLRGMDINKTSFIQWEDVPYCPIDEADMSRYKLGTGDIVVIRMADPGKVGIVEKDINAVFASYLIRLRITSDRLLPYYLFYFLLSERYQGYITGASTGTTRKSASAAVIADIDIAIPTNDLRGQFEEQISTTRRLLNNLLDRNANLRHTRDLLLPKLVSGEIDVSGIELSEN